MSGPAGYSRPMRAMHWLTVALLLFAYPLAWSVEQAQSAEVAARLLMLHRSVGVTVLLLTLVRLVWRGRDPRPALPSDLPAWQRWAAQANVAGLYLLLLAQPSLGLLASWLHGDRMLLYGFIHLPVVAVPDRGLSRLLFRLHGEVALALLALIGLHVGAALHHLLVRRDAVMSGMLGPCPLRRGTDKALTERTP
jgi:cytochrome b561